ncbi:hypothetical protein H6G89_00975 [Oscillatoria sp. FACHB-1407]|nr:hypothetical protein [Oscillatoria sp. FACHB-1407]
MSSSTLQTLFAQFQTRYPMASLVSEFLTVHDGMYAVRAIAQIGNTILATGMAAHPDLEAAEDRAKVRALEALAMSNAATSPTSEPSPRQSTWASPQFESVSQSSLPQPSPEATTTDLSNDPITQDLIAKGLISKGFKAGASLNAASTPNPSSGDVAVPGVTPLPSWTPPAQPVPPVTPGTGTTSTGVTPVVADFYSHINADADEMPVIPTGGAIADTAPETPDPTAAGIPGSSPLSDNGKPRRKTAAPEPPPPSPASVDLSDVIAQTDVELARLGWNKVQGREHLKRTYGKRSRQELNETELYDFLHYLQAQ